MKLFDLAAAGRDDLFDYVRGNHWRATSSHGVLDDGARCVFEDHGRRIEVDSPELVEALQSVPLALMEVAGKILVAEKDAMRAERSGK